MEWFLKRLTLQAADIVGFGVSSFNACSAVVPYAHSTPLMLRVRSCLQRAGATGSLLAFVFLLLTRVQPGASAFISVDV